jgi:hypothetical protein
MRSAGDSASTPYLSNRVHGSFEPSDVLAIDLNASVTHYGASPNEPATTPKTSAAGRRTSASTIAQFMLASSYMPSDHFVLDADVFVSPDSTSTQRGLDAMPVNKPSATSKGAIRDKTSTLGFDVGAEYDTAGDSRAESIMGLNLGATAYSTTQAVRLAAAKFGAPEQAALMQWHVDANFIETLFRDTDLGLAASYYMYNRDTTQSAYDGPIVLARSASDSIPLAPLQYAIRPSVAQRFGALRLRANMQYGNYRAGEGWSLGFGLKAQYKLTQALRVWVGGNVQRDRVSDNVLTMLSTLIGLRVVWG